jgi:tetratricopeptide (TPR) repeat protein
MRGRFFLLLFAAALTVAMYAAADDGEEAEKHFQEGKDFFEQKQYERASFHLDKACKLSSKWQYLEYLAKTYLAMDDYENATSSLETILKKAHSGLPTEKRAWAKKELERIGQLKERKADKKEADVHFDKARELFNRKEYEKAAIELEQAYDLNPSWEYLDLKGRTEAALKNYKRAVEAFEKFLSESGESATGARRASVKKALEEVETLLDIEKNKEEALDHYETGKELLEQGDFEKAAKSIELAYSLYPNWEFLEPLGRALANNRAYRRAIDAYETYLGRGASNVPNERREELKGEIDRLSELAKESLNAQQSKSVEQKGALLLKDTQYAKALAQFQQAYELDPNIGLFVYIAQAEAGLGRYHDAIESYKKYLAEGGEGISPEKRSDVSARIEDLNEKLEIEAQRARALSCFKLGVAFFDQGLFDKAAAEFDKAYEIDPSYQILPRIAETQGELKNYDIASAKYDQYLADGGDKLSEEQKSDAKRRVTYYQARGRGESPDEADEEAARILHDEYGSGAAEATAQGNEARDGVPTGETAGTRAPSDGAARSYDWDPRSRFWTWIVGGVGVAGCLGAIVTGAIAHSEQKKVDEVCPNGVCTPDVVESASDRQETVGNLRLTTRILVISGGALVVGGIALFFVEPLIASKRESAPSVSFVPFVDGEAAGFVVEGRF